MVDLLWKLRGCFHHCRSFKAFWKAHKKHLNDGELHKSVIAQHFLFLSQPFNFDSTHTSHCSSHIAQWELFFAIILSQWLTLVKLFIPFHLIGELSLKCRCLLQLSLGLYYAAMFSQCVYGNRYFFVSIYALPFWKW